MDFIENQIFDRERALYAAQGLHLQNCRFDGPADGESALKECRNIRATDCYFNLRYPFWHDRGLQIRRCALTPLCRAALWYSDDITIDDSCLHGIKALRECGNVTMTGCDVDSAEFGWFTRGITMTDCAVKGEYFMLRSYHLRFSNVQLNGKYSFQYIEDAIFDGCDLNTKDAFWHAKNVTVRNSTLRGEYLAWYCENVTFENCTIIGTQPLCYCKGLKLINCQMYDTDLSFEKSQVEATLTTPVLSIKNPTDGFILVPSAGEILFDDADAHAAVVRSASSDEENAKNLLHAGGYTCVLIRDGVVHTATARGVKPLLQWLDGQKNLTGFHAADKVVGKATAFLYCLLGVGSVQAGVMSESALAVLKNHGIRADCDRLVPHIINRSGDGICPFEAAVLEIHEPSKALAAIRDKAAQMNMG